MLQQDEWDRQELLAGLRRIDRCSDRPPLTSEQLITMWDGRKLLGKGAGLVGWELARPDGQVCFLVEPGD